MRKNTSLYRSYAKIVTTQICHCTSNAAEKLNHLSSEANQAKEVLNVIRDIADQTYLLALNAAIEASRSSEHGRGFAVVADEVCQLAEKTQSSLAEINTTINVIIGDHRSEPGDE